jgi:hypothetical protein
MAPEQAAGRADTDHRVDVYALGTILYEMLVGRVPHKGETVVATLAQQMLDPITPPRRMNPRADVSDKLEQVIMTALAKDRDKRYHSMGELWVGLESAAGGVPLEPLMAASSSRMTDGQGLTPQGIPTFVPREETDRMRGGGRRSTSTARNNAMTVPDVSGSAVVEAAAAQRLARIRTRRLITAGVVILAAAGITSLIIAFTVVKPNGNGTGEHVTKPEDTKPDAGTTAAKRVVDAGAIAGNKVPDATVIVLPSFPPDAGTGVVQHPGKADAGPIVRHPVPDAGAPQPLVSYSIRVTTQPTGGVLAVSGEPEMSDGVTLRRVRGTKLRVTCAIPNNDRWQKGSVVLVFDGRATDATCRMQRKKSECVDELKTPYPCPD